MAPIHALEKATLFQPHRLNYTRRSCNAQNDGNIATRKSPTLFVEGIETTVMRMAQALFIWGLMCGHTILPRGERAVATLRTSRGVTEHFRP